MYKCSQRMNKKKFMEEKRSKKDVPVKPMKNVQVHVFWTVMVDIVDGLTTISTDVLVELR